MGTITKIFKPRRGLKSTMTGTKASTVLSSGEMFIECQGSTVGKGKAKIKIGDGTSAYSSLDYAVGDTSTDPIAFSANTSSSASSALSSVSSGATLQTIVAGLKQAASLNASAISKLNDDSNSISSLSSSIASLSNRVTTLSNSVSSFTNDIWTLKNLYVGNRIEIPLTGTNTGTYTFSCCYQNNNIRYLYCIDRLNENKTWEEACNCSWTATINGYTISDIKIPTKNQLETARVYIYHLFNTYYPICNSSYLWTSTKFPNDTGSAYIYIIDFDKYECNGWSKSNTRYNGYYIYAEPFIVLDTSIFNK